MRLLFAAFRLDADRSSAGIGRTNLIRACVATGHEVDVLTPPERDNSAASVARTLPFREPVGRSWRRGMLRWLADRSRTGGSLGWICSKGDAALAYVSGRNSSGWLALERWRSALRGAVDGATEPYDWIVACSAGTDFTVPLALLAEFGRTPPVPFVTHYHDPFPSSLYPPPYREWQRVISHHEERWHRRLLAESPGLAFASARLRDWVLGGSGRSSEAVTRRAPVLMPHPALGPAGSEAALPERGLGPGSENEVLARLPADGFVIVHTGLLLHQRDPSGLLAAWRRFVARDPESRAGARLALVGAVHRAHGPKAEAWRREPGVLLVDERIPHRQALALCRDATAAIVLEANAPVSPFYPGKLADLLWLDTVIVGLTPPRSVVRDVLGDAHPLCTTPDDEEGILQALEEVWKAWKLGPDALNELKPPQEGAAIGAVQRVDEALAQLASSADARWSWKSGQTPGEPR